MKTFAISFFGSAALLLGACSSSESSSSTQSFKCCVNGAYYQCSSQEGMSHCAAQDMEQFCPRKASEDDQCD